MRAVTIVTALAGLIAIAPAHADEEGEFAFAQHLMRDKMYDLAAQQLQIFIENHPTSRRTRDAFLLLADAYVAREDYIRAADTYQGFVIKYPQDVRAREMWLKEAQFRMRAGQFSDAAREFQQLADAYPESDFADDALLGAGESLFRLGERDRAERILTHLLDRYPDGSAVPAARVRLAELRLYRGDVESAEHVLRPVLAIRAMSSIVADGLYVGTRIAVAAENPSEARRLSDRLVAQAPGDERTWQARMTLASYLHERGASAGDTELLNQAADLYKDVSRRATTSVTMEHALFELAKVREHQQAAALALSNWQDFLQTYPASEKRPRAMLGLGRAHLLAGNDRDGIFTLEELLTTYPDSIQAALALGDLGDFYLRRGDAASAVSYYERQLARMAESHAKRELKLTIAKIRDTELGESESAAAIYRELASAEDDIAAEALFGLASAECNAGNLDAAESAYRQVTQRFPMHSLAGAADDSLTLIRLFLRKDISGALEAMLSLEGRQLMSGGDAETMRLERKLELAKIRIEYLKDYEQAISLLESYLADQRAANPAQGEHLLGQSHLRLATRAKLARDTEMETAHREKALAALARLADQYPESDLADDAFIETTEARLAAGDSEPTPKQILDAYTGFFERYPNSDRRDFVLVRMAECVIRGAAEGVGSPQVALRQFNEAIEIAPNGPELDRALYGSALLLNADGRTEEAKLRLQRLIAERPLSRLVPEARFRLAVFHLDQKDPRTAARELEKLLRSGNISRDVNDIRVRLIEAYERSGAYEQIIPVARQMAMADDASAAAQGSRHLASALLNMRQLSQAADVLADELAARPGAADADSLTLLRAQILLDLRLMDRVTPLLTGFERQYPRSRMVPTAWRMLADVQFDQGAYEEALANYRRVLQANDRDKDARFGEVLSLYRLGRANEAQQRERALRNVARLTSEDEIRLSLEEGHALFRARDFLGAIDAFAEVVKRNPESQWADDALLAQGRSAAQSGRIEPAVVALERLIRDYVDSPLRQEAAFELGNAYFNLRFYEQAAESYVRVLEMDTTTGFAPEATWNLIISYEQIQRLDSAIRTMRSFLRTWPDHRRATRIRVKIAENLNRLGEFEDAIIAYHEALEYVSGEELGNARFGLGEAYYNSGDYRLAIVEWLKMAYHSETQSRWAITALFRAAKANERMGRMADAANLYQKIVTIEGEGSDLGRTAALQLLRLNQATGGNGESP